MTTVLGDARALDAHPGLVEPQRRVGLRQRIQRAGQVVEIRTPVHVRCPAQRPHQRELTARLDHLARRGRLEPSVERQPRLLAGGVLHAQVEYREVADRAGAAVELLRRDAVGDHLRAGGLHNR